MASISNFVINYLSSINQTLVKPNIPYIVCSRSAARKTTSTTSNKGNSKPKHRGCKRLHGDIVTKGTILATQNTTRFHPGLNVGFGYNGSLFAIHPGKVLVTCEKINPNWEHTWIQKNYGERNNQTIYKKHYHVIPETQHTRFKLIDKV